MTNDSTPTPQPSTPLIKSDASPKDVQHHWETYLIWEKRTSDSIDFKWIYAAIAGDAVTGLLLSQILYWSQPAKSGAYKMADKEEMWIAKERSEWHDECYLTVKQVVRSMKVLRDAGIIKTKSARFHGRTIQHFQLQRQAFLNAWHAIRLQRGKD